MEYIKMFIEQKSYESAKTASSYEGALSAFCKYFGISDSDAVKEISNIQISKYLAHLKNDKNSKGQENSRSTVRAYFIPVRSFYKFMVRQHFMVESPASDVYAPPAIESQKDYLVVDEVDNTDEIHEMLSGVSSARQRAMFLLDVATGLRVSEMCDLTLDDIQDGYVVVRHGKGDKMRTVAISPDILSVVQEYIAKERIDGETLFTTKLGNRCDISNFNKELKRLTTRVGIDKNITPHSLRHTAISLSFARGVSPIVIRDNAGHTSFNTTNRYAHTSPGYRRAETLRGAYSIMGA